MSEGNVNFNDFGDDLDDIFEPRLWVDSEEPVELIVRSVRTGEKNGRSWLLVNFTIVGEVGFEDISEFFSKPSEKMSARMKNQNREQRRGFAEAFGFNWNELEDPQQLINLTGFAKLGVKYDKRDQVNVNYVREFISAAEQTPF